MAVSRQINPYSDPGVPDWYFFWTRNHTKFRAVEVEDALYAAKRKVQENKFPGQA